MEGKYLMGTALMERQRCRTCVYGVWGIVKINRHWIGETPLDNYIYGAFCNYHYKPLSDKPYNIDCSMDKGIWPVELTCKHYESKGESKWTKEEESGGVRNGGI